MRIFHLALAIVSVLVLGGCPKALEQRPTEQVEIELADPPSFDCQECLRSANDACPQGIKKFSCNSTEGDCSFECLADPEAAPDAPPDPD